MFLHETRRIIRMTRSFSKMIRDSGSLWTQECIKDSSPLQDMKKYVIKVRHDIKCEEWWKMWYDVTDAREGLPSMIALLWLHFYDRIILLSMSVPQWPCGCVIQMTDDDRWLAWHNTLDWDSPASAAGVPPWLPKEYIVSLFVGCVCNISYLFIYLFTFPSSYLWTTNHR